jgi:uncharacterized protein YacL
MKKVGIIIGLVFLFLIVCQALVLSAKLINEPSTLLFNTGLLLFGIQIFSIIVLVNETYKLIVKWSQKTETTVEKLPEDFLSEESKTKIIDTITDNGDYVKPVKKKKKKKN